MTRESTAKRQVDPDATPISRALWLIDKLEGDPKSGRCCCPAHDDEDPSLDVSLDRFTDRGQPLLICRAGCQPKAVFAALRARGLWPIPGTVPPISNAGVIKRHRSPEERLAFARKIHDGVKRQRWEPAQAEVYFQTRGINTVPDNVLVTLPWKRGDAPESRLYAYRTSQVSYSECVIATTSSKVFM
jgi:hypothetical protein